MGNIVTSYLDFSNLDILKDVVHTFFPDNRTIKDVLNKYDIWLLNQRRHLIVHRAGYVDRRYLDNTGDNIAINTKIRVSPEELKKYFHVVRDVAVEVLNMIVEMN